MAEPISQTHDLAATAPAPEPIPAAPEAPPASPVSAAGRELRIDALKCLAIVMVIATHVLGLRAEFNSVAPWLVKAMVAFDMPLFAFLSGWVLSGREGRRPLPFLGRKVLTLIVPYAAWIAIELPFRHVAWVDLVPRLALAHINPHAGLQMWFLWVLFGMFVIFTVTRLISASSVWTAVVAIAVGAVLLLPPTAVLGVDKIAWLYPFFILGYLAARHRDRLWRFAGVAAVVAVAALAGVALLGYAHVAARFAAALAGMLGSFGLYAVLPRSLLHVQAWIGRRTLGVYGGQMLVLPYLVVGSGPTGAALSWAIVLAASCVLVLVLERILPLRAVFLGRWPRSHARTGVPARPAVDRSETETA